MEKQPFKQLGKVPIMDSSTPKKEEEVPPKQPRDDSKTESKDINIEQISRDLNMEDSSLRSGCESTLEQNISSYSSTVSMDNLLSSPAVSQHSFPLGIITSVIDITEPEETLLDINTKPDNKLIQDSTNIAGVLKSSLAVDPSTDEFEDDEVVGVCFDLDKFLPLNSKPSEEKAPALPICDQQLQITPNPKPRKSLLSRFDPFYLSTPNREVEAKTLLGREELVKEQRVLCETQPHDVPPNSAGIIADTVHIVETSIPTADSFDVSAKTMAEENAELKLQLNASQQVRATLELQLRQKEEIIAEHLSELQKISEENDTVKRHLANLELAFSDVHQKYERSKKIIAGYKCTENALQERLNSSEDTIIKSGEKYEILKAYAKAKIEESNQEMQAKREEYETEVHKLSAIIKHLEIKNTSLTESLDQKTNECSALTALCDEMTRKIE